MGTDGRCRLSEPFDIVHVGLVPAKVVLNHVEADVAAGALARSLAELAGRAAA